MASERAHETGYVQRTKQDTSCDIPDPMEEIESLRCLVGVLERNQLTFEEELLRTRSQLDENRGERTNLQGRLTESEAEIEQVSKELEEMARQNSNLANLYVASYQLHETLIRPAVLETVQEIIVNLLGSEELAIYEIDESQRALSLVKSMGVDIERHKRVSIGSGVIGRVASTGEAYFNDRDDSRKASSDDQMTVCVPMIVNGKVTGVIAIFSLLPQKEGLVDLDHELLEMLSTQAATAIYCADHSECAPPPL